MKPILRAAKTLLLVLVLVAGLMAGEVVFGVVAGSLALLADAGNLLADVGSVSTADPGGPAPSGGVTSAAPSAIAQSASP